MGHEIWRIEHHYNPEYRHQKSAGQTSRQPATINAGGWNYWAVIFTHWEHWARNPENWAPLEARISPLETRNPQNLAQLEKILWPSLIYILWHLSEDLQSPTPHT